MSPRPRLRIGNRVIGDGQPCLIIGEVGQAHDGSLGQAHAFIDAIATAGADAVKFQTHLASAESTPAEPWRIPLSTQDANRYAYWKRTEFTEPQWRELKRHADERGLVFLSSPFSIEAVDLLERVGVPAWKIASGEVANVALFERMAATRRPILLSTGMSPWCEIEEAVRRIRAARLPLVVLQATSRYPCPPEQIGLNVLGELRARYGCAVGLSDHSGTIYAALAATTLGIAVLEVHVTLSREAFGPDVAASVTTAELRQLVQGVRAIETMRRHPVDKDAAARDLEPLRQIFTRSLVARTDMKAGTVIRREHLVMKKPGTGIAAGRVEEFVGHRLAKDVEADTVLQESDFEPLDRPRRAVRRRAQAVVASAGRRGRVTARSGSR